MNAVMDCHRTKMKTWEATAGEYLQIWQTCAPVAASPDSHLHSVVIHDSVHPLLLQLELHDIAAFAIIGQSFMLTLLI